MNVNNSMEKANDFVTPAGNQFEILYSPKVMPDGSIELVESGKKDLKEEINSWAEHTDMAYILRSMAATGQAPQCSTPLYGDFSEMPNSMAEAMQLMLDAETAFYQLDIDKRNRFDNDFKKWLVMMHSDEKRFSELMDFAVEKPAESVESEVKE